MTIRKSNIFIPLAAGILAVLLFACGLTLERKRYPTYVINDLSEASLSGFDRYEANRMRSMVYEPSMEISVPDIRIRQIDVNINTLGSEEKDYPQTIRVYPGNGSFSFYTSDAAALKTGVNRLSLDFAKESVSELRFDFTGMHGKLLDVTEIVINPAAYSNLPFLMVTAVLLILAAMELSVFMPRGGAAAFSAGLSAVSLAGAYCLLMTEDMRIQPFYLLLAGSLLILLYTVCSGNFRGRYALFLLSLLGFVFLFSLWWSLTAPMGEGADEGMHMDIARFIYEHGQLPRGDDPEIRNPVWGISYAFSPIFSFMVSSVFMKLADLYGMAEDGLLAAARFVSVLSGTGAALFAALAARYLFSERSRMRYAFPAAFALFPEMLYLCSYVNCDAFALMTCSMILLAWVRGAKMRWRIRDCVFLAVSLGLCALSYYNAYGYILMSVPLFFISCGKCGRTRGDTSRRALIIVLLTFSIAGWWFVRNAVIYRGDILGRASLRKAAELYAAEGYRPSDRLTPKEQGLGILEFFTQTDFLKETLTSFVGRFSNFTLQLKMSLTKACLLLIGIGLFGNVRLPLTASREKRSSREEAKTLSGLQMEMYLQLTMLLAMLIPVVLSVIYSYGNDYQPQGRYIMPCLLPLMFFVSQGLDEIENFLYKIFVRRGTGSGEHFSGFAAALLTAFAGVAAMVSLAGTVYRFYV